MQTYVLTGDYQQVATAGAVIAQSKGGGTVHVFISAAQPSNTEEGFELRPENENQFASVIAAPLWARSSATNARLTVSVEGL